MTGFTGYSEFNFPGFPEENLEKPSSAAKQINNPVISL